VIAHDAERPTSTGPWSLIVAVLAPLPAWTTTDEGGRRPLDAGARPVGARSARAVPVRPLRPDATERTARYMKKYRSTRSEYFRTDRTNGDI
jgi:hypothetical protein